MSQKLSEIDITYGENPQQKCYGIDMATGVANDPLAIGNFELTQGANPSFCNITDLDRMLQTITHIAAVYFLNTGKTPLIAIGAKHGNACGVSVSENWEQAVHNMLNGDLRAIFGGSIMVSFPVDGEIANELVTYNSKFGKRLLDMVVAPFFTPEALEVLQRKNGKLRLFANPALATLDKNSLDCQKRDRYLRGGHITQDNYTNIFDFKSPAVTKNAIEMSEGQKSSLMLAWAIAVTSNSNTITLVKDNMLIGNGVGQQDRVSAAELGVKRASAAGHDTNGSVAFGDSFFPFTDGPEVLAKAGVSAILTTNGSVKDAEVAKSLTDRNVVFWTVPDNAGSDSGRGFYAH
ncbi:hypothetical protein A3F37_03185 [Candidatus Saccharibacteria bacterium RIFCSPHIGHO2_12_FULL_41_12]|nr:MAG: hypothetical protein A3F37_03185 [Candidatus Saccharibacteria bacterium RIFCSPHIGHO2_12_FULL_41_12]